MKKGFKKLLTLSLVGIMTIGALTGCGTKSTGSGDKFIIGGLGPLTGEAASYGISVKQGAEIAIEEINNAGGVKVGDKKLELVLNFKDDEADGEVCASAYNALMDEGAQAILGTVTSGAGLSIKDLTNADKIFQITPSGSALALTEFPNQFRLCFTDPFQGNTMADRVINKAGYKKIAVIFNNGDDYSIGVKDAFVAKVKELGGEIVALEAYAKGDVDFNTQLTKIKGTDAEAIFVPGYYDAAGYITTQAAELGMKLPFLGSDGWDGVIDQVVDPAVLEGAIFLTPFYTSDQNPLVQDFVKKYKDEYKSLPDQFAADGYDTVYVMKAALEKAGSTDSQALIDAMAEISVSGLTGDMRFTADREANKGAKFVEIKNGEYVAKED